MRHKSLYLSVMLMGVATKAMPAKNAPKGAKPVAKQAEKTSVSPEAVLKESVDAEVAGNYDGALDAWAKGKGVSDPLLFQKRMGWLYFLKQDYEQAHRHYGEAATINSRDVESLMGDMLVSVTAKEWERAVATGESILKLDPENYLTHSRLADGYYNLKKYSQCVKYCLKFPLDPALLSLSGWSYLNLGSLDLAELKFLAVLKLIPGHILANSGLLEVYHRRKDEYYKKLKKNPASKEEAGKLITLLLNEGSIKEAARIQAEVVKFFPKEVAGVKRLGYLQYLLGQYKESVATYRAAVDLGDETESLVGIIVALGALKDYTVLQKIGELLLEKEPNNYYAHYHLGLMYLEKKNFAEAEAHFKRFPLDGHALAGLGKCRQSQGDETEAKKLYLAALYYVPSLPMALRGLQEMGLKEVQSYLDSWKANTQDSKPLYIALDILAANAKSKEVAHWCEQGLKVNKYDPILLSSLAWHHYLLGHFDRALEPYGVLLKLNIDNDIARRGVVNCYFGLKKFKTAIPHIKQLMAKFPDSLELRGLLNSALFAGGLYKDQAKLAQKYPEDLSLQRTLGWSRFSQGRYHDARKVFEGVLEKLPEDAGAEKGFDLTETVGQGQFGFFFTNISYQGFQKDKGVATSLATFSPNAWWHLRGLYSRTETKDAPVATFFGEDAWGLGFTHRFNRTWDFSFDWQRFNNTDPLTDNGSILCFQLGDKVSSKTKLTMEMVSSDFTQLQVTQYSPRIDYRLDSKWALQYKGYYFDREGGRNPKAKEELAVKQTIFFTPDSHWSVAAAFYGGKKRYSFESEKLFSYNSDDLYKGGFGLNIGYRQDKWLDYGLTFHRNEIESYYTPGKIYHSNLVTGGIKYRY